MNKPNTTPTAEERARIETVIAKLQEAHKSGHLTKEGLHNAIRDFLRTLRND